LGSGTEPYRRSREARAHALSIHVVHFSGRLNAAPAERLREACLNALRDGASEIWLHFASEGGQTFQGFTLYNFLRSLPVPLTVHNLGNVESISLVVYLAADTRRVSPQGRFLIHPLHWSFEAGRVDHARLREYVGKLDNDLRRYVEIFEERTAGASAPISVGEHLSGSERLVPAAVSISAGIAHEVAEASIPAGAVTWSVSSS
jgi:ATP-dependent Clp protease protease subunit